MRGAWIILFLIAGCSSSATIRPDIVDPGKADIPGHDLFLDTSEATDIPDIPDINIDSGPAEVMENDMPNEEIKDYTRDSDGDGVSDGDEIDQGTDPNDPSDALKWHPEIQGYPRLFFGPDDADKVKKDVLTRIKGPASVTMDRVRKRCDESVPAYKDPYDPYVEETRAKIAKACAFLGFIEGDQDAVDKANSILKQVGTDFTGITLNSPFYSKWDILMAESIEAYLFAYDLLAATGAKDIDSRPARAFCDAVFDYGTTKDPKFMLIASRDNHSVKFASAIGMCGMMFNDNPRAALYVDFAATFTDFMMDYLIDADGGDAEGPNYNEYGAVNYLPFFAAYHRLVGETRVYRALKLIRMKPPEKEFVRVNDFIADPKYLANNEWLLKILMPDGRVPNIEDANCVNPLSGLIAGIFQDPRFLANWESPAINYSGGDMLPETLCLLGDFNKAVAYEPRPFTLMPDAGHAVFRGSDTSWMMVVAEHGDAVAHGGGHEQMDPTQWLYYAMGEYLVIDSGYINWENRDFVAHPKNHNMILIDGSGPDDGPLGRVTEGFFDPGDVHMISARTKYKGCDINRKYYFFDTTIAVASSVNCATSHKITQLLHLNAGGDTDGKLTVKEDGFFHITRQKAVATGLNTCIDASCEYETREDFHAFTWGRKHKHSVLSVSATNRTAKFFSAMFVSAVKDPPDVVSRRNHTCACLMKITGNPEVICQCDEKTCEITVGEYKFTVGSGLSRFIFDASTMTVIESYGPLPTISTIK